MATLTGGVIVALGHSYAGLISSSDKLASKIIASGQETGELVWRLPLHQDFSETLKSKFADMRNSGGRYGSASIGASFVQKFVKTSEWAHLDIAGVAFGTKDNEICTSWGTGFGVRLLWRFLLNGRV